MALFESYERRIDKINEVLNSYGIASLEEAEKITKDADWTYTTRIKGIQPTVLKMHAGLILRVRQSQSKKDVQEQQTQQQQSERDFRHSVFRVL